ncbi:MAG: nucleotidyltransferase family protein [Treponema sp.]
MIFPHFPAGIILASGLSSRMGVCKQLLPLHGKPLIQYGIEALFYAGIPHIYITVSDAIAHKTEAITEELMKHGKSLCSGTKKQANSAITLVHNPHPEYGQGFSTALATAAACERQHSGFLFCPADQPFLKSTSIQALCRSFLSQPDTIVSAAYGEQRGTPVIFPAAVCADLCALCGDIGGRAVIKKHQDRLRLFPLSDAHELFDIDTVEDFQYAQDILEDTLNCSK